MKDTKKRLLSSIATLFVCFAMLIGSTYAWFTDSASTGVNKIQAGNLDVQLLDESGNSLEGKTLKWVKASGASENESVLWEPGATYYTDGFQIKNAGNLALKFKITINGVSGSADLLDVIDFYLSTSIPTSSNPGSLISSLSTEYKLGPGKYWDISADGGTGTATTVYLVGHMQEEAGNKYQGKSLDNIGITLAATQDTVESDSYDNQYDKNAQYPDVAYVAVSAPTAEDIAAGVNPLANALISASTETGISGEAKDKIAADLAAGTFKLTDKEGSVRDAVKGMEVTLNGAGADKTTYEVKKADASGEGAADYSFDGAKAVVFKNMTVEFGLNTDYQGFVRAGAVRFENCTIKGMGANWGVGDVVFDNCNFVFPEGGNKWTYNLWTYGGSSFTFNNCTFTSDIGKFINVYRQANNGVVDVTLNGCKFISKAISANKAAVKINGDHAWNVTINNCTTQGVFPTDNSGLWQIKDAVAGNQITVDGVLAYSK